MNNPMVTIEGTTYELSTKLRVAYMVQGQNGHKPYSEIFSQLDNMTVEKQIDILYAAFKVANPEAAKTVTDVKFLNWYLDNYNISYIMEQLKDVIGGILGKDFDEDNTESSITVTTESEGN